MVGLGIDFRWRRLYKPEDRSAGHPAGSICAYGPKRLTSPMNRLTSLNGFDLKKFSPSKPDIEAVDLPNDLPNDLSGGLLSSDAFEAIFGSGNQPEKNACLKTLAVVKDSSPLFFSPLHYESRYDYPLIVWLHGCGSSERELEELMPYISIRNYVAVAPRGTKAVDPNGHRYTWAQTPASIALAEELVFDAIEKASGRYSIANKKVFLAGRGAGGTMAWRLALRNPKQFAGCVSLGGAFPKSHRPLATIKDLRHLRSLWMVGEQSQSCGVDTVVDSLPLFHTAKLRVAIRQYNCGDELYADMFSDMNRWLMEIVTNQVSTPVEDSCVWGGLSGLN
jgi:phospholipase/carboxylesterase